MAEQFQIPLRSRQAAIPFAKATFGDKNDGPTNYYTFRTAIESSSSGATGFLGIYPDSYARAVQEDISMKHLFAMDYRTGKFEKTITFDTILNTIPAILIREYNPQSRLDSAISYFMNLYRMATDLFLGSKEDKEKDKGVKIEFSKEDMKKLFTSIGKMAKWSFDYIIGTDKIQPLWKKIDYSDSKEMANFNKLANDDKELQDALFNFPFTLYYFIQTSLTTNIYEFPAILPDGRIYSSTGHEGWNTGANELSITGLMSKIPILGSLLKSTLNNISVNFMPWWDSQAGHKTAEPDITIKFHLFNDNVMKAVANFMCVNTFIANNKWFQYNMYQQGSSLYEIKIEGCTRLFACTCNATVRSVGNIRTPPENFYTSLKAYCYGVPNPKSFLEELAKNRVIKIPDVYEVELTFKSILPANFNNFMYQYSAGEINTGKSMYSEKVTSSLKNTFEEFQKQAKAKFDEFYSGSDANKPAASSAAAAPAAEKPAQNSGNKRKAY